MGAVEGRQPRCRQAIRARSGVHPQNHVIGGTRPPVRNEPLTVSESAAAAPLEPEKKAGFTLPSAYTILFALIVIVAILTWIIPAGVYDLHPTTGEPIPGTYHEVASHPAHILRDSLTAPINGLYGIEDAKGNINYYNSGSLFGAIDIALFILVIGGFLGVTMKTGRSRRGSATSCSGC